MSAILQADFEDATEGVGGPTAGSIALTPNDTAILPGAVAIGQIAVKLTVLKIDDDQYLNVVRNSGGVARRSLQDFGARFLRLHATSMDTPSCQNSALT